MDTVKDYNDRTYKAYHEIWTRNLEHNRQYFDKAIIPLRYERADTAVLVGAGPSLDASMEKMRTILNSEFIPSTMYCTDTAIRPVVRAGMRPHMIVTIDPQKDRRHFVGAVRHTPLIAYTTSNPDVLDWHEGDKGFINNALCLQEGMQEFFVDDDRFPLFGSGGNVATVALAYLEWLGYTKVILFGVDLWADMNRTYASGCLREGLPATDIGIGGMRIARNWIESFLASNKHVSLVNVTRYGLNIKGAENIRV